MRSRLMAVLLSSAIALGSAAPSFAAIGADGCDEDIFSAMNTNASNALRKNDEFIAGVFAPPQPAASSACMSNLMNVFDLTSLTGGTGLGASLMGAISGAATSALSGAVSSAMSSFTSSIPGLGSLTSFASSLFGGGSSMPVNDITLIDPKIIGIGQSFISKNTNRLVCGDSFTGYANAFRGVKYSNGSISLGSSAKLSGSGLLGNVFNSLPTPSFSFSLPTFTD
jgi:hypothetical protein